MKAFFRIDDVGDWKIDCVSLPWLLGSLHRLGISSSLQVIPGMLSSSTSEYLKELLNFKEPIIEIGQHGWSHELHEFSKDKSTIEQLELMRRGITKIEDFLGVRPFVFTPPEHIYTEETIHALDAAGYAIFSKQVRPTIDGKIFYWVGKKLKRHYLFGKKVSYHAKEMPGTSVMELSIAVELTRKGQVKNVSEIEEEVNRCRRNGIEPCGFLIHHKCINSLDDRSRLVSILEYIGASADLTFFTIERLSELLKESVLTDCADSH